MDSEMKIILKKLGYGLDICASFEREKITPDIVCNLSMLDMRSLGISNCSDMMKLRVECLAYGHDGGTSSYTSNGEPKYSISKETLENLIEAGFKIHELSKLLSLSERTIYRRVVEFNLAVHKFTDIDGHRLQEEVQRIIGEFPRIGETMIRHVLQQRGIKVNNHNSEPCGGSSEYILMCVHAYIRTTYISTLT